MRVTVKGYFRDTLHFILNMHRRNRMFRKAKALKLPAGPLNILAEKLHPAVLKLRIESIKRENRNTFTYRLVPVSANNTESMQTSIQRKIPFFRAGQYITVKTDINRNSISRPFSICSTPDEALTGNYYEITVKKLDSGFFSKYAVENWKTGDVISTSGPLGNQYYVPLRDGNSIICIAGGSGVTPFRSIIRDTLAHYSNSTVTLIYGVKNREEILYYNEFKELQSLYNDRFRMEVICSEPEADWKGARGFITEEYLSKIINSPRDKTFFICGPSYMQKLLDSAFNKWNLPPKRIRRENYGGLESADNYWNTGKKIKSSSFTITVHKNGKTSVINADPDETVLVAMERAGLDPPSQCRSGTCGWCTSRLISGNLFIPGQSDGRRAADKKFGYFHPCASYPVSDLEISVPDSQLSPSRIINPIFSP